MAGWGHAWVRRLERLEEGVSMILLAATSTLVFVGACGRAIGDPLPWSVDCAQLAFIWTCVFCADVAMRRHAHIRIDLLLAKLPTIARRVIEILIVIAQIVFLALLLRYGIKLALSNWQRPLGATGFSYGWVTLAMPFGAGLMIITLLRQLAGLVRGRDLSPVGPAAGMAPGEEGPR